MNNTALVLYFAVTLFMFSVLSDRGISEEFDIQASPQPLELGQVNWIRDFDEGVKNARSQDKPLLVLFQEVPGCSTSSGYGKNVLSHPLIVEAIETLFVPVAVYNNEGGVDAEVLRSFGEPSWNNPVVRIMTHDRKELTPRLSGDYTKSGLVRAMIDSLKKSGRDVPQYLSLLSEELGARGGGVEKATFAMHCFWTGEGKLGGASGVISSRPGFMDRYEVVEVEFDPAVISYGELVKEARAGGVASRVFARDSGQRETAISIVGESSVSQVSAFRPDSEPKYYLSKTLYRYLPMTQAQASRVNSAIGKRQSPDSYLSPRQLRLLNVIKESKGQGWPDAVNEDFIKAWKRALILAGTAPAESKT